MYFSQDHIESVWHIDLSGWERPQIMDTPQMLRISVVEWRTTICAQGCSCHAHGHRMVQLEGNSSVGNGFASTELAIRSLEIHR
jgi:hypothetical protein